MEHHLLGAGRIYLYHAVDVVEHVEVEVRGELGFEGGEFVFGVDLHQALAVYAVAGVAQGKCYGHVCAHYH